jgi:hypothetical protein
MALVDQLVQARMKNAGDERWDDADYRASVAKRAAKLNPKKAIKGFLDWLSKPKSETALLEEKYKLGTQNLIAADVDLSMEVRKENLEAVDRLTKKEFGRNERPS